MKRDDSVQRIGKNMCNDSNGTPKSDVKYFSLVGVLLLAIIVSLAVLWLREKSNRVQVEQDARGALIDYKKQVGAMWGQALENAGGRPLHRDELPEVTVNWDGKPRTVRQVSADAGERIGLQPGDVIEVTPHATTAPAEKP
jgi:hypothetical protein